MARRSVALLAALAIIATATLIPAPGDAWQRAFWCLRCGGSFDPIELVLNVALFVPLGLALRMAGVRWSRAVGAIIATTVSVELLQYNLIVGRDGTIRDCITNTIGGAIGFAVQPHLRALWRGDRSPSSRLGWTATLVCVAHAAMAAVLFRPSGTTPRYHVQIAPDLGQFDTFGGTVLSATVNDVPVEIGPMPLELQGRVRSTDSIALAAVVIPRSPTKRVAPILNLADEATNEIALLGQQSTAVVFQARVKAQDVGFSAPAVVINDVFVRPDVPPSPMRLAGVRREFTLRLRVTSGRSKIRESTVTLSPSLGWALWWPVDFPGHLALTWMTAIWIFVPVALVGFWTTTLVAPVTATLGSQLIVPLVLGPRSVQWPHVLIAVMGLVFGVVAGRLRSTAGHETLGT